MRNLIISVLVLALCAPAAFAATYESGTGTNNVTVSITIDSYINILWQDTDILFNNLTGSGGDWHSPTGPVANAYAQNTTASTDAFASGYYESFDDAHIWFEANTDVDMQCSGLPLTHISRTAFSLPTWFTICFSNGHPNYNQGFYLAGSYWNDGTPPGSGPGGYAGNPGSGAINLGPGQAMWGDGVGQDVFNMDGTAYAGTLVAPSNGSIVWHARCLRNGIMDLAGQYNTTLVLVFSQASTGP
jgi:hypothetical protein